MLSDILEMHGQKHILEMHGQKHILEMNGQKHILDMHGQKHIWYQLYHYISSIKHPKPILMVSKPSSEAGECHRRVHILISQLVQKL